MAYICTRSFNLASRLIVTGVKLKLTSRTYFACPLSLTHDFSSSNISSVSSLPHSKITRSGSLLRDINDSKWNTVSRHFSTSSKQQDKGALIYEGGINSMVKGIKSLSLATSFMGCVATPLTVLYHGDSVFNIIIATLCGFSVLTPALIHWVVRGYVSHMYFNKQTDTYTAWMYTFFLRRKTLQFTPDDVKAPAVRNILTAFTAKGMPVFVDESRLNHSDLYHLKGYDKLEGKLSFEKLKEMYGEDPDRRLQ